MNIYPANLLAVVFHFLDRFIHAHGQLLLGLFVYVGLPLIAWLLGRRSGRKKLKGNHTFILVVQPPAQGQSLPPVMQWEFEPPKDGSGPFGNLQ